MPYQRRREASKCSPSSPESQAHERPAAVAPPLRGDLDGDSAKAARKNRCYRAFVNETAA
jgi:hypothetical protein